MADLSDIERTTLAALADGRWHYAGRKNWRIYAGLAAKRLVAWELDRGGQRRYRISRAGRNRLDPAMALEAPAADPQ
jgi:hypothetical protein